MGLKGFADYAGQKGLGRDIDLLTELQEHPGPKALATDGNSLLYHIVTQIGHGILVDLVVTRLVSQRFSSENFAAVFKEAT